MGASPPVGGRSGPRVWQTWRTPQGGSRCREATTSRRRAHLRMEQARDSLGSREHPELRSPRSEAVSPSGQAEDGSAAGRGPVRRFTVSRDRELAASADENSGACGVAVPHLGGGISQGLRMLATDPTRRTCARWTGRAPPRRWDPRIQGAGRSLRTTSCTAMDSPAVRRRTEWLRLLRQVVSRSQGGPCGVALDRAALSGNGESGWWPRPPRGLSGPQTASARVSSSTAATRWWSPGTSVP